MKIDRSKMLTDTINNRLTLRFSEAIDRDPPIYAYSFNKNSNLLVKEGKKYININISNNGETDLSYSRLIDILDYNYDSVTHPTEMLTLENIDLFNISIDLCRVLGQGSGNEDIKFVGLQFNVIKRFSVCNYYNIHPTGSTLYKFRFQYPIEIFDLIDPKTRKQILINYSNYVDSLLQCITPSSIEWLRRLTFPIKLFGTNNDIKKFQTLLQCIKSDFLLYDNYYKKNRVKIDKKINSISSLVSKISEIYSTSKTSGNCEVIPFSLTCKGMTFALKKDKNRTYLEAMAPLCRSMVFNPLQHQFIICHFDRYDKLDDLIFKLEETFLRIV